MKEIKAIIQPFMQEKVLRALRKLRNLPGITMSEVVGIGKLHKDSNTATEEAGGPLVAKTRLEIVVPDELVDQVVDTVVASAQTGNLGDGKIFVSTVLDTIQIRTGERGDKAI